MVIAQDSTLINPRYKDCIDLLSDIELKWVLTLCPEYLLLLLYWVTSIEKVMGELASFKLN